LPKPQNGKSYTILQSITQRAEALLGPPPSAAPIPRSSHSVSDVLIFCCLVWLIHLAVQINKPAHIDDTHYLNAARHILMDPLHPFCNVINWKTTPVVAYRDNVNPPFFVYLQALWIYFFGESIRGLHLLSSLMVALAAAGGFLVARRFTAHPFLATAVFLFSPTLLPVTNLMLDVPALAIGVMAVALFIKGVDDNRSWLAALGGLLAAAALMTKYNSIVLVVLLPLYAWLAGRPRMGWHALFPVGALCGWVVHNYFFFPNHDIHLLVTARFKGLQLSPWENALTIGMLFGCSFVFFGVFRIGRPRGSVWRLMAVLAVAAIVLLGPLLAPWFRKPDFRQGLAYYVFAGNSILLLLLAAGCFRRREPGQPVRRKMKKAEAVAAASPRDGLFLWAWVLGPITFGLLFAPWQPPRYHFLAFPAFAILLVRSLENSAGNAWRTRDRLLAWGSVAAQLALGLALAGADYDFARASADFVSRVRAQYDEGKHRTFFIGHWGLQYYAEQAGFQAFNLEGFHVLPGDRFIVGVRQSNENLAPFFYTERSDGARIFNLKLFRLVAPPTEYPNRWGFTLLQPGNALLYATFLPQLPYTWRPSAPYIERFQLLEALMEITPTSAPTPVRPRR
jgi:hypothetical protein